MGVCMADQRTAGSHDVARDSDQALNVDGAGNRDIRRLQRHVPGGHNRQGTGNVDGQVSTRNRTDVTGGVDCNISATVYNYIFVGLDCVGTGYLCYQVAVFRSDTEISPRRY